jgi:hypothetical protein
MVISKCEDCNHRNICKYKDEYENVIRDITVKVPEPFILTLNCKHYYSTTCYLTGKTHLDDWSNSVSAANVYTLQNK